MVYNTELPVIDYTLLALGVVLLVADAVTVAKVIRGSRSTFALILLGFTLGYALSFICLFFCYTIQHTETIIGGIELKFSNFQLSITASYYFYFLSL